MKCPFQYEVIYSGRRTVAIQITPDGQVRVRAPYGYSRPLLDDFVRQKGDWIQKHLRSAEHQRNSSGPKRPLLLEEDRSRYVQTARDIFTCKVEYYARILQVTYGRITIREQKTRWASCSSKGNLNFNWRLIFAPEHVLDYVVVHELAHRKEMNHSGAFYAIVESVLPDYRKSQKWLRDNSHTLWNKV